MRTMTLPLNPQEFRSQTKTVTRRLGWSTLCPGDVIRAVSKLEGSRKGERGEELGLIRVISVRREPLNAIDEEDCRRQGLPELSPSEFVSMFCELGKSSGVNPETIVTRIEFECVKEADV
ncbi:ASCH domain-containing protein [Singulisphaera rosea]